MCGIGGIHTSRHSDLYRSHVEAIVESQYRRGPDFHAIEEIRGRQCATIMGHNRLSIIDLTPTGNQPMWDRDHSVCIVYNGEIYNYIELRSELTALGHRFTGSSDTEVLLESYKRWGTEAFGQFNGMFALALFDRSQERLILVRDRFGVKPLYYVLRDDTLYFASTCGAMARLLDLPPDLAYVSGGVRYGLYEHADAAPFEGMKALLPGHWLSVQCSGDASLTTTLKSYYDLHARAATQSEALAGMSCEDAVKAVSDVLDDSVRIRLRSDTPVAVSLSGGLDSSCVTSIAARHHNGRLEGFVFGDPGVPGSEGPQAAWVGKMANIDLTYVWPTTGEVCAAFTECLDAQGAPICTGSPIAQYLVFKAARSAGYKVLLGGQGGDEAFLGYRKFQWFHLRRLLAQNQYFASVLFAVTLVPTFFAERWRWVDSFRNRGRYLSRTGMSSILHLPDCTMNIGYSPTNPILGRQIHDVTVASLPTLLRVEDGNSMGNSIESRLPFLDYRVVELGIALPTEFKLRNGHGKWIVRQAMAGRVPERIRMARYKKGFDVQQNRWIDEGLGAHIRSMLHERSVRIREWLPHGPELDDVFSNEQLKGNPTRFAEATALLWVAGVTDRAS